MAVCCPGRIDLIQPGQQTSFFSDPLTIEGGNDRLSRNVGKELPIYAA